MTGKKHGYDSYGNMSKGGGKRSSMPMATDTKTKGYTPGGSYKGAGANVTASRLNKGGDMKWRGTRKGGKSYS